MRKKGVREGLVGRYEDLFRETKNRMKIGQQVSEAF